MWSYAWVLHVYSHTLTFFASALAESQAEVQAEAGSSILEEEVALAGGGEPEGIASAGVIASVLQFSGALAVAE